MEEEEKEQKGFLKQSMDKGIEQGKEEIKKQTKKAGKKILLKILSSPHALAIIAGVILALILIILLYLGFAKVLKLLKTNRANDSLSSSMSASVAATGTGATESEVKEGSTKEITITKSEDGNYTVNPVNRDGTEITSDELSLFKAEMRTYNLDPSKFTDSELKFILTLVDNGLKIDDFTEEEVKCLPLFLKAEMATQYLDLRPASEMYQGGAYKPVDPSIYESNPDAIYGVVTIKRASTDGTTTNLSYISPEKFETMRQEGNEKLLGYFTIDDSDNLMIVKWSSTQTEYSYEGDVQETEKKKEVEEEYYFPEPDKIPYKQYISKYTMPYDFLTTFLATIKNVDFCKGLANLAFNSKIVLTLQEELTVTKTVEKTNYTITTGTRKTIDYNVSPLEYSSGILIEKIEDNGEKFTSIENREYIETSTTTNKTNTYDFEITEADIWYAHYTKTYTASTSTKKSEELKTESKGVYKDIKEETIGDSTTIGNDSDVGEFKTNKEIEHRNRGDLPYGTWDSAGVWPFTEKYTDVTIIDPSSKIMLNNINSVKINDDVVSTEEITKGVDRFSVHKDSRYSVREFSFSDGSNWKFNNDGGHLYLVINCDVTKLFIQTKEKTDTNTQINRDITSYPKDPNPVTKVEECKKDEKFLKVYDENQKARDSMNSIGAWVFSTLDKNEKTIKLADVLRLLLYRYDGTNYGLTQEEIDSLLNEMGNNGAITGFYSVENISAFGCTLTKDEFVKLVKEYKKDNSTYQTNMAANAEIFYDTCTQYNVNPVIAFAHACLETGYGGSIPDNNYFGMAVYNGQNAGSKYNSPQDSIKAYCNWVITNGTIGTSANASNMQRAQSWSKYNKKLEGTPDSNIYVLYVRYSYLGDTHLCDEPDFDHPKGTDYYKDNGSTWGAGGRIYIYEMYKDKGYKQLCGHSNATDPTSAQERADYAVYSMDKRINIAKDIFGETIVTGEIGEQMMKAAEAIRLHCVRNGYTYNYSVPDYDEGVKSLWNKKNVACASYVAWVLAEVGYEDEINKCYFRGATNLGEYLEYTLGFKRVSYDNMQAGDIIVWPEHHTQMYAGNGYWYNGGSTSGACPVKYSKYDARDVFSDYGDYYILRPVKPKK